MADFFLYLYDVCLPRYSWWFVPSSRDWGTVPRPKTLASSQLAISWSVTLVSAGQQHCGSRTRQGSGTRGHRRHTGGLSCSASQNYSKMYIIVLNRLLFTSVQYSRHHVSVMRLNPIGKLGFCPGGNDFVHDWTTSLPETFGNAFVLRRQNWQRAQVGVNVTFFNIWLL